MKKSMIMIILTNTIYASILCQMAGEEVAEYSREYDDALSRYENAYDNDTKQEAREDMQRAKTNLEDASDDVFANCESSAIRIMGQLIQERKQLKEQCNVTREVNEIIPTKLQIILSDANLTIEEAREIAIDIYQKSMDWFCSKYN